MQTTQQFSITLPNDMADVMKAKVQAGEYASESEVILLLYDFFIEEVRVTV